MTDELEGLIACGKRLSEMDALLRRVPGGDGGRVETNAEDTVARRKPAFGRKADGARDTQASPAALPGTIAEFNALAPEQRLALARGMTRRERDDLLGRSARRRDADSYL